VPATAPRHPRVPRPAMRRGRRMRVHRPEPAAACVSHTGEVAKRTAIRPSRSWSTNRVIATEHTPMPESIAGDRRRLLAWDACQVRASKREGSRLSTPTGSPDRTATTDASRSCLSPSVGRSAERGPSRTGSSQRFRCPRRRRGASHHGVRRCRRPRTHAGSTPTRSGNEREARPPRTGLLSLRRLRGAHACAHIGPADGHSDRLTTGRCGSARSVRA